MYRLTERRYHPGAVSGDERGGRGCGGRLSGRPLGKILCAHRCRCFTLLRSRLAGPAEVYRRVLNSDAMIFAFCNRVCYLAGVYLYTSIRVLRVFVYYALFCCIRILSCCRCQRRVQCVGRYLIFLKTRSLVPQASRYMASPGWMVRLHFHVAHLVNT